MHSQEEKKLQELHQKINRAPVPEDRLDQAILMGIHRGKAEVPDRKKGFSWNWKAGVAQVAVIMLLFVLSVKYFDGFADVVRGLPGMENLVNEIRNEPALQDAVDNDFLQEIGVSDEHDGVKVTVHSVLADEMRMIVFYSVETEREFESIILNTSLIDQDGNPIDYGFTKGISSIFDPHKRKDELYRIEFNFTEIDVPEKFTLEATIDVGNSYEQQLDGGWEFPIEINKDVYEGKKKEYVINEPIEVEGQKLTVNQVVIYPTQTLVQISIDENNTKHIFGIEDLRLVDENGEVWSDNPLTLTSSGEDIVTYYIESNYFHEPEQLYLQFSKLAAVDKDEMKLVIDPVSLEILERPSVGPEMSVEREGEELLIAAHDVPSEFNHFYLESAIDSEGNTILPDNHPGMATSENGDTKTITMFIPYSENAAAPGTITIPISSFPAYIYGEVDIPLN
ncbi:hypothetical protein GCM10008967_41200 [Bacillus carboniphilus]|uniref:DUF4179 domain-containing protein n=1 Tax=Bacillus carboniphilus TaxID=86663 RepID=A0ABP3GIV1_9BACI